MAVDVLKLALLIDQSYRRNADKTSLIDVVIEPFKFSCNPTSGEVKPKENQVGSITYLLSASQAGHYISLVKSALSISATMHLVDQIKAFNNPDIQRLIESASVNAKPTLLMSVGMFQQKPETKVFDEAHLILSALGLKQLDTYQSMDATLLKIQEGLLVDQTSTLKR